MSRHMKTMYGYLFAASLVVMLMTFLAVPPAQAASVTFLIGKEDGIRIETTVIPAVPGTPAVPGIKAKSHPTSVRNGDCPQVPAMNGVLHTPVGLNADCVFAWSLSNTGGRAAVDAVPGTPETTVTTEVPTCTRKYKTVSTTRPFLSYSQSTSDGSC